jgi:hypothetical protein
MVYEMYNYFISTCIIYAIVISEKYIYTSSYYIGLKKLATEGVTMKEGSKFKFRISFRVQHEIIAGIKFVNKVKTIIGTEKDELVIGK